MADNNDTSNMGKKPNSLDRIGSESSSPSYRSDLLLMEQRARIETVEMQKIRQQIADIQKQKEDLMRQVARVRAGGDPATESLFRSLGLPAQQARAAMQISQQNLPTAVIRQSKIYDEESAEKIRALSEQYQQKQQARQIDSMRLFQQRVIGLVSHPRSGAKTMVSDPEFMRTAERYAEISTPGDLAKGVERAYRSREMAGVRLAEASRGVQTPEGRKSFAEAEQTYQEKLYKQYAIEEAQKIAGRQRRQAETAIGRGQRAVENILERRGLEDIRSGVKSGEFGSVKDIMVKLKTAEDTFISSLSKFSAELEKTGKVTAETREEYKKAGEEYSKQSKIAKEAVGSGGGGGGGFLNKAASGAQAALPYVMQSLQLAQFGLVGADLQQLSLRGQAASIKNQEYFDQLAAARGDMSALRRVNTGVYDRSAKVGETYGARAENIAKVSAGAQGGVGLLKTGAALFAMVATKGKVAPSAAPLAAAGVGDMVQAATTGVEVAKDITRAQVELQGAQLNRQLEDQIYAAQDAANQAMYDFRMSAYGSMMGTGTKASSIYQTAVSKEMVSKLANYGIMPDQGAALFGLGARTIGADFTGAKDQGASIVTRAAQLQEARVMSSEDYIRRVGQMASVGGGEKEVEEILSNAVRRGVNDAKSLEGIFNMAQALSRSASAMGISGALEAQRALTRGEDTLHGAPMSEMLKQALVSNAFEKVQAVSARSGQDIQTIRYLNRIKAANPDVNMLDALNMAGMEPRQVTSLQEQYFKDMKGGEKVSPGTVAALSGVPGALPTFLNEDLTYKGPGAAAQAKSALVEKGINYALSLIPDQKIRDELQAYAEGKIEQNQLSPGAIRASSLIGGLPALATLRPSTEVAPIDLPKTTGDINDAARSARAGAISAQKQIEQASITMGPISETELALAKSANAGAAGIKAAGAATSISLDTSGFLATVTKFSTAVDKLVEAVKPLSTNDVINKITGQTSATRASPSPPPQDKQNKRVGGWQPEWK